MPQQDWMLVCFHNAENCSMPLILTLWPSIEFFTVTAQESWVWVEEARAGKAKDFFSLSAASLQGLRACILAPLLGKLGTTDHSRLFHRAGVSVLFTAAQYFVLTWPSPVSLSLPLWKRINNYPYFVPGNTDSEWGDMDCSQGSARSSALPPACQHQDPLTLMLN